MSEFLEEMWRNNGVQPRKIHIKLCPVCQSIFHIPEEMKVLRAYCQDCDTDYFYSKKEDLPISCKQRTIERRRHCSCQSCGK